MHVCAYFAPGLAFAADLALLAGDRAVRAAVSDAGERAPPWARRVARLAVLLVGGTGVALLLFAARLAAIVLRVPS